MIATPPSSVLCFGAPAPAALTRSATEVVVISADECVHLQSSTAFDLVWIDCEDKLLTPHNPGRAIVHAAVLHLRPGGFIVLGLRNDPAGFLGHVEALREWFDLGPVSSEVVGDRVLVALRRTDRRTIHDMMRDARQTIRRLTPEELSHALTRPDAPTVIDTRTPTDRERFGVIAGSVHIPRTVLEWSLDPANGYRHWAITSFDQPIVVTCNGGYSSSIAAANLAMLGFANVADLVGGHHGWLRAGLPVEPPDHWSFDT